MVYDDNDPHKALYDVDDGVHRFCLCQRTIADTVSQIQPLSPLQIGTISTALLSLNVP